MKQPLIPQKELINKFSDTTLEFSVQGIETHKAAKSTVRWQKRRKFRINNLRGGFCLVPNSFNPSSILSNPKGGN